MKKNCTKTLDQINYINDKLIKRANKKKVESIVVVDIKDNEFNHTQTIQYMNNCLHWVGEYYAGKVGVDRIISATNNMIHHCHLIQKSLIK